MVASERMPLFGHVICEKRCGWVYEDDGSRVDWDQPRPCKGCGLHVKRGEQDPCIANLPETRQACCGHGLERQPNGILAGYVGLKDGRIIRFSGMLGGPAIRTLVNDALKGEPLPEGVENDKPAWWAGLTDWQYQLVWSSWRCPADIDRLVAAVKLIG